MVKERRGERLGNMKEEEDVLPNWPVDFLGDFMNVAWDSYLSPSPLVSVHLSSLALFILRMALQAHLLCVLPARLGVHELGVGCL
jgi:hypothetical protein